MEEREKEVLIYLFLAVTIAFASYLQILRSSLFWQLFWCK